MICKKCGAHNDNVRFEPVFFPYMIEPVPITQPSLENTISRWACWNCGRYHFPDGSLYDVKRAKAMAFGSDRAEAKDE